MSNTTLTKKASKSKTVTAPAQLYEKPVFTEQELEDSRQAYAPVLGQDVLAARLQSLAHDQDTRVSWLSRRELPDDAKDQQMDEAYAKLGRQRPLTATQKRKRRKAFAEKSETAYALQNEIQKVTEQRKASFDETAATAKKKRGDEFNPNELTGEFAEQARDWAAVYGRKEDKESRENGIEVFSSLTAPTSFKSLRVASDDVFHYIMATDMSQFEFKNDAELAAGFAEKYEQLKAFAGAYIYLDRYKENGEPLPRDLDAFELRAKMSLAKEMLTCYESKMKIISSPYYTLLAGKDFEGMSDEELDVMIARSTEAELTTYLEGVKQSREHRFGSGKSAQKLLETMVKEDQIRDETEGLETLRNLEELLGGQSDFSRSTVLGEALVGRLGALAAGQCPEITRATVRTALISIPSGLNGIFEKDFQEINNKVEDLLEGKEVDGKTLAPELVEEMTQRQSEIMRLQTQINRDQIAVKMIIPYQDAWNLNNPRYSPEIRDKIRVAQAAVENYRSRMQDESIGHLNEFGRAHEALACFRNDHGFILSKGKKHWERCMAEKDKVSLPHSITICGEAMQFPDISLLDRFKGKTFRPHKGVSDEDMKTAWNKVAECAKAAAAYSQYVNAHKTEIAGTEVLDLTTWYSEKMLNDLTAAVSEFETKLPGFKDAPAIDPMAAGTVNQDRKIGEFWNTKVVHNVDLQRDPEMQQAMAELKQEIHDTTKYQPQADSTVLRHAGGKERWTVQGLGKSRIEGILMRAVSAQDISPEQAKSMMTKLYASELAGLDTQDKVDQANAQVDEGVLELKQFYLSQLRRLEETYGQLPTQMHPEDFLRQINTHFNEHIGILQDVDQLMNKGAGFFDFENSEEDREFQRIAEYYNNVFMALQNYTIGKSADEASKTVTDLTVKEAQAKIDEAQKITGIGGPAMDEQALQKYRNGVKQRAAMQGWQIRLTNDFKYRAPERSAEQKAADEQHVADLKREMNWDGADLFTYEVHTALAADAELSDNAAGILEEEPIKSMTLKQGVDRRSLLILMPKFKCKPGTSEPLNEDEKKKRDDAIQYVMDYLAPELSRKDEPDEEKRRAHNKAVKDKRHALLKEATDFVLNAPGIQLWMLDDEDYLRDHAVELQHQVSRFTYFQNLLAEPRNQEFFNTLDPKTLELIRSHMKENGAMAGALQAILQIHRVDMNDGKLVTSMSDAMEEMVRQNLDIMKQNAKTFAQDRETRDREINEKYSRIEERRAKIVKAVPKNLDLSGKAGDEASIRLMKWAAWGDLDADVTKARDDYFNAREQEIEAQYAELHRAAEEKRAAALQEGKSEQEARELYEQEEQYAQSKKAEGLRKLERIRQSGGAGKRADDAWDEKMAAAQSSYDQAIAQAQAARDQAVQGGQSQEEADRIFQEKKEAAETQFAIEKAEARKASVDAFQLRKTEYATAPVEKGLRGDLFEKIQGDCAAMLEGVQASGLPLDRMAGAMQKGRTIDSETGGRSPSTYTVGGGAVTMSRQMLSMFREHAGTAEFLTYMKNSYAAYGGLKMFEGSAEQFMDFFLANAMLKGPGGASMDVIKKHGATSPIASLARESTRNLASLPALDRQSDEKIAAMKGDEADLHELIMEYRELKEFLKGKLAEQPPTAS
ncbi:MAG: hypothetical protein K6B72_05555 [Lachnospiraceae bacterium]|nr:hypothetical protein [Lachnospiraceae bacterium]